MNSNSSNYCLDSITRRSSLCPPHHDSDPVLSPPLTPAMSQHHPFDKRQSADLTYSPNHYNTRPTYSMDSYHHWMNHSATIQHMQQQQQVHHPMHHQQQHLHQSPIPNLPQQQPQQQSQQQSTQTQNQRSLMTDRTNCSTRKQPSKQNKHMCTFPECLWSFKRYEHLKRHMLVHTGERPHVCPHPGCGKRFSRSDNFHAHYRTHEKKAFARQKNNNSTTNSSTTTNNTNSSQDTSSNNTNNFLIKEEKDFNTMPYYHHHPYPLLPTPSSNKPTDYMYNQQQQQQHYSSMLQDNSPTPSSRSVLHNNNNSSISSSSSSSSTSSSNKSNKGEQKKPHGCSHPNCERKFRRLEHLKRHMRIHTQEQPFKCTYPGCLKAFSRSDNLTQHRKTHDRRGSRYQVVDPVVPVTTPSEFMHTPSNAESSFTLVDFIRDGHNNNNSGYNQHPNSPSFDNTNKPQHSILGWQHPGDTSTESVGC